MSKTVKYAAKLESELNRRAIDYDRDKDAMTLKYGDTELLKINIDEDDLKSSLEETADKIEALIEQYLNGLDSGLAGEIRRERVKKRTEGYLREDEDE